MGKILNMNSNNQQSAHETGFSRPWAYLLRGWIMLLLGATLMLLTALKPHVKFFSVDFSWLPVVGLLLMLVGVPRCLDGIRSAKSPGFFYNFQGGILDTVVGFLVFSSIGKDPAFLVLLISGYLMTQGLFRFILSFLVPLKNPRSTQIGGLLSLILGILVWMQWPLMATWFLSLSLSTEITTRGIALIQFADSLKSQKPNPGSNH